MLKKVISKNDCPGPEGEYQNVESSEFGNYA